MQKIKNILLIILFSSIYLSNLFPQTTNIKFDHIGLEQGLSQSTVNAVVQDAQGFMWFGTEDGLNRYDGYSIIVFKHNPNDSTSLSDNTIWSLLSDRNGDLWIGTLNGGVNRYVISENRFYHYYYKPDDTTTISSNFITSLFEDSNHDLWMGTDKGLNRYNAATGTFTRFALTEQGPANSINNSVWSICEDQNKNLWVGTSVGLSKLNIAKGSNELPKPQFEKYIHDSLNQKNLNGNNVHSVFVDRKGKLWVGTWGSGLSSYSTQSKNSVSDSDEKKDSFKHYINNPKNPNSISSNSIQSIYEDAGGNLWIASYDAGLMRYEPYTDSFIRYTDDALRTLYRDKSGILWIGTFASGVKLYDKRKNFFNHYYNTVDKLSDVSQNVITSVYADRSGDLWVGTYGSGLNRFVRSVKVTGNTINDDNKFKRTNNYLSNPKDQNSLSKNKILALCESQDGSIWIGTEGGGLNRFNKNTGKFTHFKHNPNDVNSILSDLISSMYYDERENVLWIGYLTGGIDCYVLSSNSFKHYGISNKDGGEIINSAITVIYKDKQNVIWAGTLREGVFRFDKTNNSKNYNEPEAGKSAGTFKRFGLRGTAINSGNQINNSGVFAIYNDNNGITWFGTYGGGLNRFDRQTNSFKYYTELNGLPNNVVYGILPDKSGNLWLSTNKGISCFNPVSETFRNYDVKDGLQANEFNQGAHFASLNGELFFGGVNGFNSFLPESINDNDYIPPIYLTTFKIFDKPLQNPGSLATLNNIELSYSQNFFSFEFVALNYTTPEKNQYAYMLEGFDKDWHTVTALQRYGSYTNLDPGEYKLRVKGSNNDGIWNEAGISITVIVTPPFWMTWWFRGLGIVLFLSFIYMIYQNRINSLKQEKELQQKISHRLIEKQEEERRRIALEMHDSLGHSLLFIKNRANLTAKKGFDVVTASENFNQISAAASEALKTVREISHNLRPPELDQLGLSETLRSILITFRESTTIKINGTVENIDGLILQELDINLVRILQEALSNIVKHSGAAECEVLVTKLENNITVDISDNGNGFNQNNTHYSWDTSEKKQTTGLGLAGMTERVRILNGSFKIESTPGKGTRIEIKIPLNKQTNGTDKFDV